MRGILTVILVSVAHSFASLACGIGDLMTGGFFEKIISPSHPAFGSLQKVLEFPLLTIIHMREIRMDLFMLPIIIVNSFLWGVAVYLCMTFIGKTVLVGTGPERRR